MVTAEKPRYFVVTADTGGPKALKEFGVEVVRGEYYPIVSEGLPDLRPFTPRDYRNVIPSEDVREGPITSPALRGLPEGSILARRGQDAFQLEVTWAGERKKLSNLQEPEEEPVLNEGPMNEAESRMLGRIAGEFSRRFSPIPGQQEPAIYLAMVREKGGQPPSRAEVLRRLGDSEMPVIKEEVDVLGEIVDRMKKDMNAVQISFATDILAALKSLKPRHEYH